MPSAYPSGLDSLAKPTATTKEDDAGFEHDVVHTNEANAIEAVQATLGVNPQGASATVVARLDATDTTIAGKVSSSDSRLSDARTPTAHAASHGSAGSDAITVAQSQVTNLTTDLAGKVGTSRTISTTAPLSGGGDLSADRTLTIADASTTTKGAVQLTDSTSSTSTTTAATPNSVKSAYDLANGAVAKSTVTTKGDLIVGTASATVARQGAGTDGYVLTADSTQTNGLKWAAASGGYATIQDEGSARTARATMNFTGYGVTATDNSTNGRTDVSIGGPAPRTGISIQHFAIGSGKLANYGTYQRQYSIPFIGTGNGFNNIRVSVETAGTSGVVRLGVYYIDANGVSQLISDWGTVSAATTGTKSLSITTWTPNIGQTYFLSVCIQGNSAVKLAGTNCATAVQTLNLQTTTLWPQYAAFYTDTVTGAFPQEDYGYYNGRTVGDFPIVTLAVSVA